MKVISSKLIEEKKIKSILLVGILFISFFANAEKNSISNRDSCLEHVGDTELLNEVKLRMRFVDRTKVPQQGPSEVYEVYCNSSWLEIKKVDLESGKEERVLHDLLSNKAKCEKRAAIYKKHLVDNILRSNKRIAYCEGSWLFKILLKKGGEMQKISQDLMADNNSCAVAEKRINDQADKY